jgi:amino acid adenylation domain-containing protein
VRILASALAGPDRHRSLLAVLSPAEEGRLLGEWNAFPDLAPAELPVHRLVERHAAARPGALALSRGSERLTYGELNRRANQLGRLLRERAGVAEAVVAVCMDRSSEWLVTVLAAFKAGAVPVLLDPRAPRRRHELALAGARPRLVLGLERLGVDLPCDPDQVVLVDREWPEIDRRDAGNLDVPVELDSLAYLVQTSGSTGVPKAVGVPHRALAHCSVQQAAVYGIRPDDRSTWFAPPGASVSIIEIWPYLGAGASLHIAEPEVVASPPALRDWLLGEQITQTFVIAPVAEILCALDWPAACPLRLMTVAGEKVRRWPPAALPFEVAVTYGSAEASYIASCLHPRARRCTSATATAEERRTPPPIGRPWPGARVHVVDADLSLMPPGAVGELAVDSPELARGYLGDPAKTAVKFVPNPFAGAPGSRLYLTGDLASWRPDGLLDHRGRVDTMVKIRGFRIEVAEVEAALLADPGVAAAVVAAVPDPRGESRLVAYVVPGGLVTAAELRGFVAERLPEPMVPAAYVFLSELPLNTTGKVDRLSLPAPDWDAVAERPPYRAPRDELERALAALWGEVLSVGDPGLDDDFFQLGGDSLRASRVAIALEERLGVRLSLRDLFVARTPAALAERLRAAAGTPRRALPPIASRRRG